MKNGPMWPNVMKDKQLIFNGLNPKGGGPLFLSLLFMKTVQIQGVEPFRFSSKQDWINNASRLFAKYKKPEERFDTAGIVCVDSQGRMCGIGADFQKAEEEGTYPVIAYRLERAAGNYGRW